LHTNNRTSSTEQMNSESVSGQIADLPQTARHAWLRMLVLVSSLFVLTMIMDTNSAKAAEMEGLGTADEPYVIMTPEHLDSVRLDLDAHYRLGADIDMSAFGDFHPIGHIQYTPNETRPEFLDRNAVPFTGTFDGGHYVISNLTIRAPEPAVEREHYEGIGLFGYVQGSGKDAIHIQNVRLESVRSIGNHRVGSLVGELYDAMVTNTSAKDIDIYGSGYIGGLIGYAKNARIEVSYTSTGYGIYGGTNVGGLLGIAMGNVEIVNSFAEVEMVTTRVHGGGLVGYVDGAGNVIENSYAAGEVSGPEHLGDPPVDSVGGLIGRITESAEISISDAYWDTEASGQASSAGTPDAIGLTTSAMQTTLAGFDANTWLFIEGAYPQLKVFWADALQALEPHAGVLEPAFRPDVEQYEITFAESASFLQVTPSSVSSEAQIKVNGTLVDSGSQSVPILLNEGENEDAARIVVTGPYGHERTYRISVTTPVEPHIPGPQPAPGPGPPAGDPVKQPAIWTYSDQWHVQEASAAEIFFPNVLAVDSSGYLYTASATHMQKWSGDGELIWERDGFQGVYGIATKDTEDGTRLYVAEAPYLNNRIQIYTGDGDYVASSGPLYTDPEDTSTLIEARGMAFNSQGLLYIADAGNHQVHIVNGEWEIVHSWGSEGENLGQFRYPIGVAIDSYNNVYVSEMNNNRIQKFDYKGENPEQWGSYGTSDNQLDRPKYLDIDLADHVYVADSYHQQIKRFAPDGQFLQKWGTEEGHQSDEDGQFHTPAAVVMDSNWNLYVADTFNHRIQKFTPVFNDPPTDIVLSSTAIIEEQPIGTQVGTLAATDADEGETFTYSLVAGEGADDNDQFTIVGDTLRSGAVFDYYEQHTYSIRVRVTDGVGHTFEKVLAITVNEFNEPPTSIQLYGGIIDEMQAPGAVVGTLTAVDPDEHDTHTYELVEGEGAADNDSFTIVGNELQSAEMFDVYDKSSYSIRVRATDSFDHSVEVHYVIGVRHVNQAPTGILLSADHIQKGSPSGTEVAVLEAEDRDRDDTFQFSMDTSPGGLHSHLFRVEEGNRLMTNADSSELENAAQMFGGALFIGLTVEDSGGLTMLQYFVLSIADSLTDLTLSNSSMAEKQPIGTVVGTLEAANPIPGQPVQYVLEDGEAAADNAKFAITGDKLVTAAVLNFNEQETYEIRVRAYDAFGNSVEQVFAISITDVNQPPAQPVLQTVTAGDTSVTVTWNPVAEAEQYHIFQTIESGSYDTAMATVTGDVYRYEAVGLTNGTPYYFVVKASNTDGFSPASEEGTATPQVPIPGAPEWRDAIPGDSSVTLSWQPVAGAEGYELSYSAVSGTYGDATVSVTSDVYEHRVTGLTNGTPYYFVLKAHNPGGLSAPSHEISATPMSVPAAPTEVRAEAGDGQAIVSFTAPTDDGGSDVLAYQVTIMPGNRTVTGTASPITITGLTNGTTYSFTVQAINSVGVGGLSDPSNRVTPHKPRDRDDDDGSGASLDSESTGSSVDVRVNGQPFRAGTLTTKMNGEQSVTIVAIDSRELEDRLEQEGDGAQLSIPVMEPTDVVIGELNGQLVKRMERQQAVVEIQTGQATYTLPAGEIRIDSIADQLGQEVALQDVVVRIQIAALPEQELEWVEQMAMDGGMRVVAPPLHFTVEAVFGDKVVEVNEFRQYVGRTITLSDGSSANRLTTGIAIEPDGTIRHIPTQVLRVEGRYYAQLNSLTNSTYAVVWHPVAFTDVEDHWAQDAVNDMGSRMVVSGFGDNQFRPNQAITRAEFAAMLVNGLGLRLESGTSPFIDVHAADWYHDAVLTASAYHLISGFETGDFRPQDQITREQAVTMIARAMDLTGLKGEFTVRDANALLHAYSDADQVAVWARSDMVDGLQAGLISGRSATELAPKAFMTRAEVAFLIQQLLQKSDLIG